MFKRQRKNKVYPESQSKDSEPQNLSTREKLQLSKERMNFKDGQSSIQFEDLWKEWRILAAIKQQKNKQCPVCLVSDQSTSFQIFGKCKHTFCSKCLWESMQQKIKNFQIIRCLQDECPQILNVNSPIVKSLSINQQQKYYRIFVYDFLSKNQNLKFCPQAGCHGFINTLQTPAACYECKRQYCKACMMVPHPGPCDNNMVKYLQNTFHFKQCSNCNQLVQKIDGCIHITCKCKYEFCYLCGGKFTHDHICRIRNQVPPAPISREPRNLAINRTLPLVRPRPPAPAPAANEIGRNLNPAININIVLPLARDPMNPVINNPPNNPVNRVNSGDNQYCLIPKYFLMSIIIILLNIVSLQWIITISIFVVCLIKGIFIGTYLGFNEMIEYHSWRQILLGNIVLILYYIGKHTIIDVSASFFTEEITKYLCIFTIFFWNTLQDCL